MKGGGGGWFLKSSSMAWEPENGCMMSMIRHGMVKHVYVLNELSPYACPIVRTHTKLHTFSSPENLLYSLIRS